MNTARVRRVEIVCAVVNNFLGNTKAANHARLISTMIEPSKTRLFDSIKMHFLLLHMRSFLKISGDSDDREKGSIRHAQIE
ncbi:Hypothetical protein FKW44_022176 [Caligus rogercresseyi]|uniref:Uncharacterized protein n=1 Tax=Caligus rogercresseyi TaxID=217165 RepID=A0A7T8GSD2_CALRO|nr:Hypothetical protein FKW44_022176 [Caligus rogercresseyi]